MIPFPARVLCAALILAGCGKPAPPPPPVDVRAPQVAALPVSPDDAAWNTAPMFPAPLVLQDMVEPRKMQAGIAEVQVRALTDGTSIAFRLEWADATDDTFRAQAMFTDSCAVQLPAVTSPDTPAPQMGEKGRPVEITFWSASAQASVDGRPDDIKVLHPNAQIDHYPFQAPVLDKDPAAKKEMEGLYAPARSLGNISAVPPGKPVQDLIAEGPGTLSTASGMPSAGKGKRTAAGWAVVISRPLPKGLAPGGKSQVAFAVWDGSAQDVGARKMRTVWIPLVVGAPAVAK